MKHKRKLMLSAVLLICFCMASITAQEIIPASGGEASGAGGTVCYTIGQLAYTKYTGANGSVTEGVQQPYEISVVTAMEETKNTSLTVSAYPNPVLDYLIVQTPLMASQQYTAHLYNITGNLLETIEITGTQTSIDMSHLVPATYLLKVIQIKDSKDAMHCVSTFKIIKN